MHKFVVLAVAASALVAPSAHAQINVYIGAAPPPVRYEVRPIVPYSGAYWIGGYWAPNGGRYRWVAGRYAVAPFENAYWSEGRWDHDNSGWRYREGKWDHRQERAERREDEGKHHGRGHAYGHDKEHGDDKD